jgi:PAS domain S-box-containing protein
MTQRDDSLKTKLSEQSLLLADKTRENKHLHQELSRVAAALDVKLNEVEALRTEVSEIQQQLKMRESERDLLAVMLNEAENVQRRTGAGKPGSEKEQPRTDSGKLFEKFVTGQDLNPAGKDQSPDVNLFHWVLESIPVGTVVLAPNGIILSANKQLLHVTGYFPGDLLGKEVCVLFEEHKGNTALVRNLTESSGTMVEARIRRKDRTGFIAAVVLKRMALLPDKRMLLCMLDLTEVRQPLSFD